MSGLIGGSPLPPIASIADPNSLFRAMSDAVAWISFAEYSFFFVASAATFGLQVSLLGATAMSGNPRRLSPNVLLNVAVWTAASGCGMAYAGYMASAWRGPKTLYWGAAIFWTAALYYAALGAVSMSVCFLMLDRCWVLLRPHARTRHRRAFLYASLFAVNLEFWSILLSLVILELPIEEGWTECPGFSCVVRRHGGQSMGIMRMSTGCVNAAVAIVFALLLRNYSKKSNKNKFREFRQANLMAKIAALTEIVFNLTPNGLFFVLWYCDIKQRVYLGPYLLVFSGIDGLSTAFIYRRVVHRRKVLPHTNSALATPDRNRPPTHSHSQSLHSISHETTKPFQ